MIATFNSAKVQSANLQEKKKKECWFVNRICKWNGCHFIHKYKFLAVFPKEVALSVTAAECGWKELQDHPQRAPWAKMCWKRAQKTKAKP